MPAPVTILMHTTRGDITLELDQARAPISMANFLAHAETGDYDGTIFHRVIPKFVVQGGGFTPDLHDRSKLAVAAGHPDRPIANEWQNGLKNVRGTIAMARDAAPDTATREFYINVADNARLDTARAKTGNAGYAVFGRVVKGMDVVDLIKDGVTGDRPDVIVDGEGMQNVPVAPVVIVSVKRLGVPTAAPVAK
jgi:peptidyl-prolyl cis-trans isomerase A (cyclophilin A)